MEEVPDCLLDMLFDWEADSYSPHGGQNPEAPPEQQSSAPAELSQRVNSPSLNPSEQPPLQPPQPPLQHSASTSALRAEFCDALMPHSYPPSTAQAPHDRHVHMHVHDTHAYMHPESPPMPPLPPPALPGVEGGSVAPLAVQEQHAWQAVPMHMLDSNRHALGAHAAAGSMHGQDERRIEETLAPIWPEMHAGQGDPGQVMHVGMEHSQHNIPPEGAGPSHTGRHVSTPLDTFTRAPPPWFAPVATQVQQEGSMSVYKGAQQEGWPERKERLKSNSAAQRRYRARQKEKTQGLQATLQQLSSKAAELEAVKRSRSALQAQTEKLNLAIAVADAEISSLQQTLEVASTSPSQPLPAPSATDPTEQGLRRSPPTLSQGVASGTAPPVGPPQPMHISGLQIEADDLAAPRNPSAALAAAAAAALPRRLAAVNAAVSHSVDSLAAAACITAAGDGRQHTPSPTPRASVDMSAPVTTTQSASEPQHAARSTALMSLEVECEPEAQRGGSGAQPPATTPPPFESDPVSTDARLLARSDTQAEAAPQHVHALKERGQQSCHLLEGMLVDVCAAKALLAELPGPEATMETLMPHQAAAALRLSRSLIASCMQLHSAAVHHDIVSDITAALTQHAHHAQHAQHEVFKASAGGPSVANPQPESLSPGAPTESNTQAEKQTGRQSVRAGETAAQPPITSPSAAAAAVATGDPGAPLGAEELNLTGGAMQSVGSSMLPQEMVWPQVHTTAVHAFSGELPARSSPHPPLKSFPVEFSQSEADLDDVFMSAVGGLGAPPALTPEGGPGGVATSDVCMDADPLPLPMDTGNDFEGSLPVTVTPRSPVATIHREREELAAWTPEATEGFLAAPQPQPTQSNDVTQMLLHGHDRQKLLEVASSLQLTRRAKQEARNLHNAHMARMHAIEANRLRIKLDAVKALLPSDLGGETLPHTRPPQNPSGVPTSNPQFPSSSRRVLRALEESLMHERRAQQELVWLMSVRVLDAVQWCAVAAALHPLHCDLEPLLHAIASLAL